MNEREKEEFIKNISTLKKEMLSKQQLTKLLSDVNEKTTGNKQVLLERIQLHYSRVSSSEAAAVGGKTAPTAAVAVEAAVPDAAVVGGKQTPAAAAAVKVEASAVGKTAPTAAVAGGRKPKQEQKVGKQGQK